MTIPKTAPQRVATIEIGSRAIRLLVAEITDTGKLIVLNSDWRETALAAALAAGGTTLDGKVNEIVQIARAFQEKSRSFQVRRICVFATEAVRQMSPANLGVLRDGIPHLEVIDRKTEACCALLGAVSPFERPQRSEDSFVIDQGSGSMELAVGRIEDSGVHLLTYKSYRLGTQELVEDLKECGNDIKKLRSKLTTKVKSLKLLGVDVQPQPIILGSAATKIGWMMARKNGSERYDPARVHGRIVDLSVLDKLVEMAIAAPDAIRGAIDPSNPKSSEFETVISGLVAISVFLKELGKMDFKVSAYGPRYGVVWMTSVYRKLGFDLPI
jgi:exopolyphosphatase/guanosine-5'-triphosphate,3'-diphosphate pyrophosphatase